MTEKKDLVQEKISEPVILQDVFSRLADIFRAADYCSQCYGHDDHAVCENPHVIRRIVQLLEDAASEERRLTNAEDIIRIVFTKLADIFDEADSRCYDHSDFFSIASILREVVRKLQTQTKEKHEPRNDD